MKRIIRNRNTGEVILAHAHWCASYWCHLRGLMFRRRLEPDEGLLFVHRRESIVNTSIHMLFMLMPIGVVWLDEQGVVVDAQYAKPWRLAYAPKHPAQYYLEAPPGILERVQVGDHLRFDEPS
ncbi:MAG: hypothetical protein HC915_12490 [Anaerolineae bacterium]|nr:hypothetical protein [Anaerolineae bacterium]